MSDMRRRKFIALFGAIMTALAAEVCVERAHAYTTPYLPHSPSSVVASIRELLAGPCRVSATMQSAATFC